MHRAVTGDFNERIWADMGGADHLYKFPRRKHRIHIMSGILSVEEFHLPLAFLCHTRHDGEGKDLIRRNTKLFCEICLHDSAEHLLRGFRGGEIVHHVRELGLHETHPAGAAGREHRSLLQLAARKPFYKLRALLHDREIRREYRIKGVVHAHAF